MDCWVRVGWVSLGLCYFKNVRRKNVAVPPPKKTPLLQHNGLNPRPEGGVWDQTCYLSTWRAKESWGKKLNYPTTKLPDDAVVFVVVVVVATIGGSDNSFSWSSVKLSTWPSPLTVATSFGLSSCRSPVSCNNVKVRLGEQQASSFHLSWSEVLSWLHFFNTWSKNK